MTYKSFEELPVWRQAAELFERTDDFLEHAPPRLRPSFKDQLERAVLSVSNNIAEGFERGSTNELLQFIYIARGSAGEVRSMLGLAQRRPWAKGVCSEISNLKSIAANCAAGRTRCRTRKSKANGTSTGFPASVMRKSGGPLPVKSDCWRISLLTTRCGRRNLKSEISNGCLFRTLARSNGMIFSI